MSDRKQLQASQQHRAESAMALLKSLAKAGDDPEHFAQACLDWSRLSDDATPLPEFQSVMALLSQDANLHGFTSTKKSGAAAKRDNVFELDIEGRIASIARDLSEFLALKTGDRIDIPPVLTRPESTLSPGSVLDINDRFGISRKVKIHPVFTQNQLVRLSARVGLFTFSHAVADRLRTEYGLTSSEIEILQLTLRRLNLEHIADWRGIKLSTVRTHVSRTINKLGCHSLVEAVATVLEFANVIDNEVVPVEPIGGDTSFTPRRIALNKPQDSVEYRRFGSADGRAVVVLHSLEYGYFPSKRMIETARLRNINLIFPVRPGFGETVAAESPGNAAQIIADFIAALDVSDVTLVGLSTAAPLGLLAGEISDRVARIVLVNYGLNVADKLKGIQPAWVRGMLRMSMNSPASFAVGLAAIRSIVRSYGGLRFYKRLYRNQAADEAYLDNHLQDFEAFSKYILNADAGSVRNDIVSAFLPNHDIERLQALRQKMRVINSNNQHGVDTAESEADAARLGVAFATSPFEGRNWMFQHPEAFFALALDETDHTSELVR